jgi:pentatricopeptide repeat protein
MASATVVVMAHWHVSVGQFEHVRQLVDEMKARSLEESGCMGYEIFIDSADDRHLLLVERYVDNDALDTHRRSKHYREIVQGQIVPLLASRSVDLLQPRDSP